MKYHTYDVVTFPNVQNKYVVMRARKRTKSTLKVLHRIKPDGTAVLSYYDRRMDLSKSTVIEQLHPDTTIEFTKPSFKKDHLKARPEPEEDVETAGELWEKLREAMERERLIFCVDPNESGGLKMVSDLDGDDDPDDV